MARASPRRRHGRRTLMCSSQPRWTPSRSFSSGQIQFWTTPAIWSPSQATTHRSVSSSGRVNVLVNVRLGHLAVTPVVAERLVLGLEDGPPVRLLDRPDLEALGQRGIRDLIQAVATHQEEVADRLEPGLGEERPVADGGVLDPRRQLDRDVRILAGRARLRPLDAPVEQPASDARAVGSRGGPRLRPCTSGCRPGSSARHW